MGGVENRDGGPRMKRDARLPYRRGARASTFGSGARGALLATAAIVLVSGCATTKPIGRLLDDPYRFDGRVVRVEGEVVRSAGALGYGAYQVDDGTGTLYVLADGRGVPREGARVKVAGRFQALLTLGRMSVAGMVEEKRGRAR